MNQLETITTTIRLIGLLPSVRIDTFSTGHSWPSRTFCTTMHVGSKL